MSSFLTRELNRYFLREGWLNSAGLLILRVAIGAMMIHHGHEKLADPANFAAAYVAPLHLPFPIFFAQVAGFSELIGSWFVILGFLTPLGCLALAGTMTVAAYHHILTSGLNIYLLELVVLYLGGSLAILLTGPGRISFDAGIVSDLLASPTAGDSFDSTAESRTASSGFSSVIPQVIPVEVPSSAAGTAGARGRR